MTKTVDFDAFRRERKREPKRLIFGGKEYRMAPSIPASLAVDIIRLQQMDDGEDVPLDVLGKIGGKILGKEDWEEIMESTDFGVDELGDLIQMILAAYTPTPEVDPEDPSPAST